MDALEVHQRTAPHVRDKIAAELARYYSGVASDNSFSLTQLMCAQAGGHLAQLSKANQAVCESAAMLANQNFNLQRAWVPLRAIDVRALATIPGSKGGYLAGPDTLEAVDVLRPWSVVASAGVQLFTGLVGNVVLPRTATAVTAGWYGPEGSAAPSETPPTLGEVSMMPRTAVGFVKFSIQLLRQGVAVESYLRMQLLRAVGELLDIAFFAGAGGVQPPGLLNTTGIGTQSGTSLAHAGLLTMRQKVLTAGGREAALQWVGAPAVQELIGARERATGGGRFLWDSDGILGKPANATKNAPANALTVGDFGQAAVGIFGPGIRIDVDPSQDFNTAGLVARVLLLCDVAFPQPAAFTVATSIT
jgi:HK97 family phage major capsid protein